MDSVAPIKYSYCHWEEERQQGRRLLTKQVNALCVNLHATCLAKHYYDCAKNTCPDSLITFNNSAPLPPRPNPDITGLYFTKYHVIFYHLALFKLEFIRSCGIWFYHRYMVLLVDGFMAAGAVSKYFTREIQCCGDKCLCIKQMCVGDVGCVVWDAALVLSAFLEQETYFPPSYWTGKRVIELGAGTGVVGLVAAARG